MNILEKNHDRKAFKALIQTEGAVKKSATKPVDFLDMEAHGL